MSKSPTACPLSEKRGWPEVMLTAPPIVLLPKSVLCGPFNISTCSVSRKARRDNRATPMAMPSWKRPTDCSKADRKSVVKGKSVSVRLDLGGRGVIKKKKQGTVARKEQRTE